MCRNLKGDLIRDEDKKGRYQLRCAAGLYWLTDTKQPFGSYSGPVPLNECGAEIWRMLESGVPEAEICGRLCEKYGIPPEQANSDVRDFTEQLRAKKVSFGGTE